MCRLAGKRRCSCSLWKLRFYLEFANSRGCRSSRLTTDETAQLHPVEASFFSTDRETEKQPHVDESSRSESKRDLDDPRGSRSKPQQHGHDHGGPQRRPDSLSQWRADRKADAPARRRIKNQCKRSGDGDKSAER